MRCDNGRILGIERHERGWECGCRFGRDPGSPMACLMDLDHPGLLFSGLILGSLGMGFFLYGRKQGRFDCLAVGIALSVIPFFAHSLLVMWGLAAACFGGLYAHSRMV
jgi:hypothetical protein